MCRLDLAIFRQRKNGENLNPHFQHAVTSPSLSYSNERDLSTIGSQQHCVRECRSLRSWRSSCFLQYKTSSPLYFLNEADIKKTHLVLTSAARLDCIAGIPLSTSDTHSPLKITFPARWRRQPERYMPPRPANEKKYRSSKD